MEAVGRELVATFVLLSLSFELPVSLVGLLHFVQYLDSRAVVHSLGVLFGLKWILLGLDFRQVPTDPGFLLTYLTFHFNLLVLDPYMLTQGRVILWIWN